MPTSIEKIGKMNQFKLIKGDCKHQVHHIKTFDICEYNDAINSRVPLFFNSDIIISIAHINVKMDYLYRNGHFDELLYKPNVYAFQKMDTSELLKNFPPKQVPR